MRIVILHGCRSLCVVRVSIKDARADCWFPRRPATQSQPQHPESVFRPFGFASRGCVGQSAAALNERDATCANAIIEEGDNVWGKCEAVVNVCKCGLGSAGRGYVRGWHGQSCGVGCRPWVRVGIATAGVAHAVLGAVCELCFRKGPMMGGSGGGGVWALRRGAKVREGARRRRRTRRCGPSSWPQRRPPPWRRPPRRQHSAVPEPGRRARLGRGRRSGW